MDGAFARTDLDETLAQAFTTGWALHELRRRHVPRTDTETLQAAAGLAGRLLERGAVAICERYRGGRPWNPAASPSASPIASRPTWSANSPGTASPPDPSRFL
ncbi:hypothetical protein [Streptomyces nojiriensis]|uniref:hypothetical protein n=1 Tax=Streptomyces nojiriensis TaxID=66374 RepID=UPI001BB7FD3C|nr:hypothetical protein [Streptomyces nojiriensis]QTI42360.1 hypothetical protein JYK04_00117 [Streptomyces nojiriensis]